MFGQNAIQYITILSLGVHVSTYQHPSMIMIRNWLFWRPRTPTLAHCFPSSYLGSLDRIATSADIHPVDPANMITLQSGGITTKNDHQFALQLLGNRSAPQETYQLYNLNPF